MVVGAVEDLPRPVGLGQLGPQIIDRHGRDGLPCRRKERVIGISAVAQGQQRLLHGACGGHHDQRGRQAGVLGKIVKPLEGGGEELQVQGRGGVDEVVLLGEIDVLEGVPAVSSIS